MAVSLGLKVRQGEHLMTTLWSQTLQQSNSSVRGVQPAWMLLAIRQFGLPSHVIARHDVPWKRILAVAGREHMLVVPGAHREDAT